MKSGAAGVRRARGRLGPCARGGPADAADFVPRREGQRPLALACRPVPTSIGCEPGCPRFAWLWGATGRPPPGRPDRPRTIRTMPTYAGDAGVPPRLTDPPCRSRRARPPLLAGWRDGCGGSVAPWGAGGTPTCASACAPWRGFASETARGGVSPTHVVQIGVQDHVPSPLCDGAGLAATICPPLALWCGRERALARCPHAPAQGQDRCSHARTGFARCAAPLVGFGKGSERGGGRTVARVASLGAGPGGLAGLPGYAR